MIKWIQKKFSAILIICFIFHSFFSTIIGGILGVLIGNLAEGNISIFNYRNFGEWFESYSGFGCCVGLVLGLLFGFISGIIIYGFCATIIHISDSTDSIFLKLHNLKISKTVDTDN